MATSGMERGIASLQVAINQEGGRIPNAVKASALSLKLEKATAKGLNSGHLVQPNPQDSPGFRERKFILGSDEGIIDCPGIERRLARR